MEDSSEGNLVPLETSALRLDEKANDTLTVLTKRKIRNDINDYYIYIREQFNQLDKEVPDSFELIASQVRTFYLKLKRPRVPRKDL